METQNEDTRRRRAVTVILLILLLCVSGAAAVVYSISISGVDNGSAIIPTDKVHAKFVDESGDLMVTGGFSSGITITYSSNGSSYQIFAGNRTLGSSKLVIDATQSNAKSISLASSVKHLFSNGNTSINGLPYNMVPEFVFRYGDSEGAVITDLDDITITPKTTNTFYVELIGVLNEKYTTSNESELVDFTYEVTFEATAS